MGQREETQLPIVKEAIEKHERVTLHRLEPNPQHGPTADFEGTRSDGTRLSVEHKELVPGDFLALSQAVRDYPPYTSQMLSRTWWVAVSEDPLSERIKPMPNFPDDPPQEEIDSWEEAGFKTVLKAEREEQHRRRNTLRRRPQVQIKNLGQDIENDLAVLESLEVYSVPSRQRLDNEQDELTRRQTEHRIRHRTHNAIISSHEPHEEFEKPGVVVHFSWGYTRGLDPNEIAERIQLWLDSDESANLKASLLASDADQRHAALFLSTDAMAETAKEQGDKFVPTAPLSLGDSIDVVWAFVGPAVLRYQSGSWLRT